MISAPTKKTEVRMITKEDKQKTGAAMILAAMDRRRLALALMAEAEEDIAKGRQMIEEAQESNE